MYFSKTFNFSRIREKVKNHNYTKRNIDYYKSKAGNLSHNDLLNILKMDKNDLYNILPLVRNLTLTNFGKNINLFAPVYVSNLCSNNCVYCCFGKEDINYRRLNKEEITRELKTLSEKGFKNILIVSGQYKTEIDQKTILQSIETSKDFFHSISIEIGSYEKNILKEFCEKGSEKFILYQETYNPDIYKKVHLAGIKSDFNYRLDSIENALISGFDKIGTGFLLGLSDPLEDCLSLFEHIKHLYKYYMDKDVSISFPRISPKGTKYKIENTINDFEFLKILSAFRLAFPTAEIVLSTRESSFLRDKLMNLCVTSMSAEVSTNPGGYSEKENQSTKQFQITDNRNLAQIVDQIERSGYFPVFKNWDIQMN